MCMNLKACAHVHAHDTVADPSAGRDVSIERFCKIMDMDVEGINIFLIYIYT